MILDIVPKRPIGRFSISLNGEKYKEDNLFTNNGMQQIYKPGKNTIISTSDGGIFKHCRVGNGRTPLTTSSISLSNGIPITSKLTSSRLTYSTEDGVRYAQGIFKYEFIGDYSGSITEIMLTSSPSNTGMICGKTLDKPLVISSGDSIKVTYVVKIPIISNVDNILDSGTIVDTETGREHKYTFSGRFHVESQSTLSTVLPLQSGWVISGNLSRMYVNNNIMAVGQTRYKCDIDSTDGGLKYNIKTSIMGNVGKLDIVNANFANTDTSSTSIDNYPFRIVCEPPMSKPAGLDWNIDFGINIKLGEE